jgi:DNA helicase HerA-like ATPase
MEKQNLILGPLEIRNLTQRKISILGGTGSGKTSTLKMIAAVSPVPVYIFDPLNVIRIKDFDRVVFSKTSWEKGAEAGKLFSKMKPKNMIFSFRDMLQEELSQFMNAFFSNWKPHSCLIAMDEIHEFIPEGGVGGKYAPEIERAVRHWRNEDIGFVLTSQRPALVKKNVLALTDYLVVYRTTWPHDIQAIKEILQNMPGIDVPQVLAGLQTKSFLEGYALDFRGNEQA